MSHTLGDGRPKPAGTWDWYGSLDPAHHPPQDDYDTFSVGVFQWVEKYGGKTTKKGKAVKRISGPIMNPFEVYQAARKFISAQK